MLNNVFLSPLHTTYRMQLLDRWVYEPLFRTVSFRFQRSDVGRIISQYEVTRFFGEAYLKATSAYKDSSLLQYGPQIRMYLTMPTFCHSVWQTRLQTLKIHTMKHSSPNLLILHNPIQVTAIAIQCFV